MAEKMFNLAPITAETIIKGCACGPGKIDERVTIKVERDVGLRCHEYQVTTVDREGKPAQGFTFLVSDKTGFIVRMISPIDMTGEEAN